MCSVSRARENIHNDGHTHISTGPGIQPIRGIRKARLARVQGLGSVLTQLAATSPTGPRISSDAAATPVSRVSSTTNSLERRSSAR